MPSRSAWGAGPSCRAEVGQRIRRGHHLLPMALQVLVPLVVASLGQRGIIAAVATTKVSYGLGFPAEVDLDHLLTGGMLGGDV